MNSLILVVKGFFMGIANVIPGVSGGTIAIILGIYEQLIGAINHFLKDIKKNIKLLTPLAIGLILAVLTMSKVIEVSYDKFPVPIFMFFVGLVIGGIPLIKSNIKNKKDIWKPSNLLIMLFTLILVVFLASYKFIFSVDFEVNLNNLNIFGYLLLFIVGMIASATMIIPGISGSLVLMILGYYYPILSMINSLVKFDNLFKNILVLGVFGLGVLIGIILVSKLIEKLLQKYRNKTFYAILGFVYGSVIAIPISTFVERDNIVFNAYHGIGALITVVIGFIISYKLGEK